MDLIYGYGRGWGWWQLWGWWLLLALGCLWLQVKAIPLITAAAIQLQGLQAPPPCCCMLLVWWLCCGRGSIARADLARVGVTALSDPGRYGRLGCLPADREQEMQLLDLVPSRYRLFPHPT